MKDLQDFRKNAIHSQNLQNFLASDTGQEFSRILRKTRHTLTKAADISEGRACGRHDVFQELDDLLFLGTYHVEPTRKPQSNKANSIKPHTSQLP